MQTEVENIFSDGEVAKIVEAASVSAALDVPTLAKAIRASVEGYVKSIEIWRAMTAPKPIGYRMKDEGRKRPGGKRSRPGLERVYANPPLKKGRPPQIFEADFFRMLRLTWEEAAGHPPAATASSYEFYRGPFVRLCDEVLKRAGIPLANSAALINKIAASRDDPKDF